MRFARLIGATFAPGAGLRTAYAQDATCPVAKLNPVIVAADAVPASITGVAEAGFSATASPTGPAPYSAAGYVNTGGLMRGEKLVAIQVLHDHSQAGTAVSVTPAGGEAPLMIPSTDVLDLRMNAVVGRDSGAFHIAAKQTGLYLLNLLPPPANADDSRRIVAELRTRLGMAE